MNNYRQSDVEGRQELTPGQRQAHQDEYDYWNSLGEKLTQKGTPQYQAQEFNQPLGQRARQPLQSSHQAAQHRRQPQQQLSEQERQQQQLDFQRRAMQTARENPGSMTRNNTAQPMIPEHLQGEGSRYKKPYLQSLFRKQSTIRQIFENEDYVDKENEGEYMAMGENTFSLNKLYNFYEAQHHRYPSQPFVEVYLLDSLSQFSIYRSEFLEFQRKIKRVSQLTEKLNKLNWMQQILTARLHRQQAILQKMA